MKMLRYTCFFLAIFFAHLGTVSAQKVTDTLKQQKKIYPTSFKLLLGDFHMLNTTHNGRPVTQLGLSVNRTLYKNFGIGLAYIQWTMLRPDELTLPSGVKHILLYPRPKYPYEPVVGQLQYRVDYKMLDVWLYYQFIMNKRKLPKHIINTGLGITHNWGYDVYVESYTVVPGYLDGTVLLREEKAAYWGLLPSLSYSYLLLKNRLCIGVDIRARIYSGWPQPQFDYGIHFGVNF